MASDNPLGGRSKLEFDVNMTCGSCEVKVRESLEKVGVYDPQIDVQKQTVVVDTDVPFSKVQEAIQSTGRKAVLKGYGSSTGTSKSLAAAVSELFGSPKIFGVVRFSQMSEQSCVIDGTIDGLDRRKCHQLRIHELGDLSSGCESTGDVFDPPVTTSQEPKHRVYGDLGEIDVNTNGRSVFRKTDDIVKVWDIIGRSLVVCSRSPGSLPKDDDKCARLACGVIARAAGVSQNPKRICACDGTSVWDEARAPSSES